MSDILIVAAFDVGTTYSGWAYAFTADSDKKGQDAIKIMQPVGGLQSNRLKVPTSLFMPDSGEDSFGYLADDAYQTSSLDGRTDYMYFSRFKMTLNNWDVNDETLAISQNDQTKTWPVSKVFSRFVKCLVTNFHNTIKDRVVQINPKTDIHYVITVPAIWTDPAKQIMRKAAVSAGIPSESLTLALEPEACSLLCRSIPSNTSCSNKVTQIESISDRAKYVVVDAGGGTIDVAVHEIKDGKIRELYHASGGGWGGTMVDGAFEELLISIFGQAVMKEFHEKEIVDVMELRQTWEMKKRLLSSNQTECTVKLPPSLLDIYKTLENKDIAIRLSQPQFAKGITLNRCFMRLSGDTVQTLFSFAVGKTTSHLKRLLEMETNKGVVLIFMAGGFSDCSLLVYAVREAFPDRKVIVPSDASLCTLQGAVMYGTSVVKYEKSGDVADLAIKQRMSRYTYGYDICVPFVHGKHPLDKCIVTDNGIRCNGVFKKVIEIGQTVDVAIPLPAMNAYTVHRNQTSVLFNLFSSESKDHVYTDEKGCRKIGELTIMFPEPENNTNRKVEVMFTFGGTELKVSAKDVKTGHSVQCQLEFSSIEKKMSSD